MSIEEKLKSLPAQPGVYIMKDKKGAIIYVGKSKTLRNRVRQYFHAGAGHAPKVAAMVAAISDFDYILTDSELEALILECNLIKEHRPRYNILLKDDKNYPYIKVTINEEYPRIFMTRRMEKDNARYFGPYPGGFYVREMIDLLQKAFKVAACKKSFPRDLYKSRPCIYYSMRRCQAPCAGLVSADEYKKTFHEICAFLDGKNTGFIEELTEQMQAASDALEFEKAIDLRNKIEGLKRISERQRIISNKRGDIDIFAYASAGGAAVFEVFYIRGGKLLGSSSYKFETVYGISSAQVISEFLNRFYEDAQFIPPKVLVSQAAEGAAALSQWLAAKRGGAVLIHRPQRGELKKLMDMALKNAGKTLGDFEIALLNAQRKEKAVPELAAALGLANSPQRIEAYDISNTAGSENVGSMVVFLKGAPAKSEYRRFKIKVEGADDYACMREVLRRRLARAKKGDGSFGPLPDIILVDGGRGHVSAAREALGEAGLSLPVFGMVKDGRHRTRALTDGDAEADLNRFGAAFRLIAQIQDEAHRFAINYHRSLRRKKNLESELKGISGVGDVLSKRLMSHFKSIDAIRSATIEEIMRVKGVNRKTANNICEFFKKY